MDMFSHLNFSIMFNQVFSNFFKILFSDCMMNESK